MIANAAVRFDGDVRTGRKHAEIALLWMRDRGGEGIPDAEFGFVTDDGQFVDKHEAFRIAVEAGQVKPPPPGIVCSLRIEDLWEKE
jgi:hypothetical protein